MESPRFQLVLHPGKQVAGKEVAVNFHQLDTPQKTAIQFPKISATISQCFPGCSEMAGWVKGWRIPKGRKCLEPRSEDVADVVLWATVFACCRCFFCSNGEHECAKIYEWISWVLFKQSVFFGCTPRKANECPLKMNGWFRCIFPLNRSNLYRGAFVRFRGCIWPWSFWCFFVHHLGCWIRWIQYTPEE